MSTSNDKYRQLHHALVKSPDYMGIPNKERSSCRDFIDLATKVDGKSPPAPEKVETAYVAAVDEARKLVAKGLLTIALPSDGPLGAKNPSTESSPSPPSHQKYEIHPTAAIFPMMSNEALDELAADIKEHDLRDPIVIHNGQVIDGRNRLEGCHRAGVEPKFEEWAGIGSVVSWIISVNVHRRHLTDTQRAVIAARVAQELAAEAKARVEQNFHNSAAPSCGLDPGPSLDGRSAARAAKLLNVSRDATNKATKIAMSGSEELVQAVTDGTVSLDAAAKVAELPKSKQRKLVEKGQVQAAAKKIRQEKAEAKAPPKKATKPEPTPASEEDEPRSAPPPPTEVAKPVAAPEPPPETSTDDADEDDDREETVHPDPDDAPLLREAHRAINEMVQAGRAARKMKTVATLLGKVIAFCNDYKTKLENAAMP